MDFLEYNLPDVDMLNNEEVVFRYLLWQPQDTLVILGRSNNNVEDVVFVEQAQKDGVDIYQRPTGGQSVVISPDMLCISITEPLDAVRASKDYFFAYNQITISALKKLGIKDLGVKGISDIAIKQKKIAGTAMYRNRLRVFYHAVLNVAGDLDLFERYLKYPPKVPDYREGRSHKDFVTSLRIQGYQFSVDNIKNAIENELFQYKKTKN
ncbi:biotin/lipoate A/B protein ligase family protein [Candidatus Uabimicrobium sp. HlEnr_7]|uniref:lipoate--protein ligase family protein n=1 Tax=Candidatus Uabimicrobium helgolandensis TaxID=3095367 RepID=UPI0035568BB1